MLHGIYSIAHTVAFYFVVADEKMVVALAGKPQHLKSVLVRCVLSTGAVG